MAADFSGGHLSSDGGVLLLREVDRAHRLCEELAGCFSDHRNQDFVEHDLAVMLRQRIMGIALGYEDLNDHERLRLDPLLAAACGRADVLGERRHQGPDKGRPLAGKSTLNRLEAGAGPVCVYAERGGSPCGGCGCCWAAGPSPWGWQRAWTSQSMTVETLV